jgi:hypothetical protein
MPVTSTKNYGVLNRIFYSKNGEVSKDMLKRAHRVARHARMQAPVKTGRLKRSIKVYKHERYTRGQSVRVGTSVPYANYVHEGTKPHLIIPNSKRALKFTKGQSVIITRRVNHPGTRPNRFLADNVKWFYL